MLAERVDIDVYTRRALVFINQCLNEISEGKYIGSGQGNRLIARIVVEQDPAVLSPALGGRLIAVEQEFCASNV